MAHGHEYRQENLLGPASVEKEERPTGANCPVDLYSLIARDLVLTFFTPFYPWKGSTQVALDRKHRSGRRCLRSKRATDRKAHAIVVSRHVVLADPANPEVEWGSRFTTLLVNCPDAIAQ